MPLPTNLGASTNFNSRSEGLVRPAQLALAKAVNKKAVVDTSPGAPPPALANLDYWAALEIFKRADFNHNGTLDEEEFGKFMHTQFPADRYWMDIPKLFSYIDKDGDGSLKVEEFFSWIYSVPRRTDIIARREQRRASRLDPGSPMSPMSPMSPFSATASPLSPTSPMSPGTRPGSAAMRKSMSEGTLRRTGESLAKPSSRRTSMQAQPHAPEPEKAMKIEFTYGPDFVGKGAQSPIGKIEQFIKEHPISRSLETARFVDHNGKGMMLVKVKIGKGIVVWDHVSMKAYREDPFTDYDSMERWVRGMCDVHFPLFLRVVNL